MLLWLKRLFCKHNYKYVGYRQQENYHVRYSERFYRCTKCGKYKIVDGRTGCALGGRS